MIVNDQRLRIRALNDLLHPEWTSVDFRLALVVVIEMIAIAYMCMAIVT